MTNHPNLAVSEPENPAFEFLIRACSLFGAYPVEGRRSDQSAAPPEGCLPMNCPHCQRAIAEAWLPFVRVHDVDGTASQWPSIMIQDFRSMTEEYRAEAQWMRCPAPECLRLMIRVRASKHSPEEENKKRPHRFAPPSSNEPQYRATTGWDEGEWWFAVPRRVTPREPHPDVPAKYTDDYREAAAILELSPQASAALARRVLSHVLHDEAGYTNHNLTDQINAFNRDEKHPEDIKEALHLVRDNGDFAAHVQRDQETGEVVKVTPEDASWNLDVLDTVFEYLIVQPKARRQRMEQHEERSKRVGRSPLSRLFKREDDSR